MAICYHNIRNTTMMFCKLIKLVGNNREELKKKREKKKLKPKIKYIIIIYIHILLLKRKYTNLCTYCIFINLSSS